MKPQKTGRTEARVQKALQARAASRQDAYGAWVKGRRHKDIKGSEAADKEKKQLYLATSLMAWSPGWAEDVRKKVKGRGQGFGKGKFAPGEKALSAYTWCMSGKGPFNGLLHRVGKAVTDWCGCGAVMTGTHTHTHIVEECPELEGHQSQIDIREWREGQ